MRFKKIIQLFEDGNVSVFGLRGTGKDVMFGNVIERRNEQYVSNINYGKGFNELRLSDLMINNNYNNFINNQINQFNYKYPQYADIYISDCGIFLPSQYCNELNKKYEGVITFQALSRQIAQCNIHTNAQNLQRVWDKVREQSDIYILCRRCIYLFGFVLQFITIYDKYDSAVSKIKPCRISTPIFATKELKQQTRMYLDNFYNQHGSVRNHVLLYFNKSKHDTLYFGKLLRKEEFPNVKRKSVKLRKERNKKREKKQQKVA